MKVILRQDTAGLGKKGDVLEVADGYGRNYLVPTGRALPASEGALAQAESMRKARDLKEARDRDSAQAVADALAGRSVVIEARAGSGGRLFGSVSAADIAEALHAQAGVTLDRRRMVLDEPIRSLGRHEIPLHIHPEVEATLIVEVTAAAS